MNPSDFPSYKTTIRSAIRAALAEAKPGTLDEAAFPAYSHPNPFINWLFWQRLRVVMNFVQKHAPFEQVLDFGCGSGRHGSLLAMKFAEENDAAVMNTF